MIFLQNPIHFLQNFLMWLAIDMKAWPNIYRNSLIYTVICCALIRIYTIFQCNFYLVSALETVGNLASPIVYTLTLAKI